MRDEAILVGAIRKARAAGRRTALATVVRVSGSAYRKEGAKLVVDEEGHLTGIISGGCLEPEIAHTAQEVMRTGRPTRRLFDMAEDVVWGLGLGCGGTVEVFVEPVGEGPAWDAWLEALERGEPAVRALVHGAPNEALVGRWVLWIADRDAGGTLETGALRTQFLEAARTAARTRHPRSKTQAFGGLEVLFDVSVPPAELVIFGAGHDAIPVAELGRRLGFKVVVVDPRPAYANATRFPDAEVISAHPEAFPERVRLGPRSYAVIMNHHLERDRKALRFLLGTEAPYIGVLGPRSRFTRLLEALREEGFEPDEAALARVHSPVGLDIGAEGPEEIAVSILAEILAVRGGFRGGFLRAREGGIHEPVGPVHG